MKNKNKNEMKVKTNLEKQNIVFRSYKVERESFPL